jgi:ribonuclease I
MLLPFLSLQELYRAIKNPASGVGKASEEQKNKKVLSHFRSKNFPTLKKYFTLARDSQPFMTEVSLSSNLEIYLTAILKSLLRPSASCEMNFLIFG